ncbi:MAG TPA: PPOX class F420-dependent oxidoreductase, partial [Actinomycetota bacterium]|nr:PPOX class F420-dependent oxidoreductase [Actinomycetota bacterium]
NQFLDSIRHRGAFEIAREPGVTADFSSFRGRRQCLLVSFKRSGDPVPSPVNFGLSDEGLLYFRCDPDSAKVKRMTRDPHVRACACSFRGKPLGPLVEGTARMLEGSEAERAASIVAANWDLPNRIYERSVHRLHVTITYVEVRPSS